MPIKARPFLVILSMAFMTTACTMGADAPAGQRSTTPKTLADVQAIYKTQTGESHNKYQAELARWSKEYMGELKKYDDWCTREGNSNGGMAVQTAMERLKKENTVGEIMVMPEAEGLAGIQQKFQDQRKEIESQRNKQIEGIKKYYISLLKDISKTLKKAEIQKIDDEIRKIGGESSEPAPDRSARTEKGK